MICSVSLYRREGSGHMKPWYSFLSGEELLSEELGLKFQSFTINTIAILPCCHKFPFSFYRDRWDRAYAWCQTSPSQQGFSRGNASVRGGSGSNCWPAPQLNREAVGPSRPGLPRWRQLRPVVVWMLVDDDEPLRVSDAGRPVNATLGAVACNITTPLSLEGQWILFVSTHDFWGWSDCCTASAAACLVSSHGAWKSRDAAGSPVWASPPHEPQRY